MPVTVAKRGSKFRVVENGKIAKNKGGTSIDGGGHVTRNGAVRQARAVNASLKKSGKI